MAARVRRDGARRDAYRSGLSAPYVEESAAHRNVSAEIVDRAVEEVLQNSGMNVENQDMMRQLLANDSSSAVAQAYYHSVASGASRPSQPFSEKPRMEIPYMMNENEVALLSAYAPDFNLRFYDGDNHDHPLAAACRLIDRKLVDSRIPKHMTVSDVGGSVIPLILTGELGRRLHTCAPIVDAKDPSRRTLARLRANMLAKDVNKSLHVRESARSYLNEDVRAICNNRVQDCKFHTSALTSIHVYDIPMEDWASVMVNKNAKVVEGCMLFPEGIFESSSGIMESAGARYECDVSSNSFRMGFVDSPSWWYQHKLSDYLKYGVDQTLYHGDCAFSYKIIERRGDTLFFRILQVARNVVRSPPQFYRVPGVPMVKIRGFPLDSREHIIKQGQRVDYTFPALLWSDMLGYAKSMVERKTLSQEKLFNYYRTVSPRQSINAVVVSGGTSVEDLNHLLPLIVHVAFFALLEVARTRVEVQEVTDALVRQRKVVAETVWYKLGVAFGESITKVGRVMFYPFYLMSQALTDKSVEALLKDNYEWHFQPEFVEISASLLLPHCFSSDDRVVDNDVWLEEAVEFAPLDLVKASKGDPAVARLTLDLMGGALPVDYYSELQDIVDADDAVKEGIATTEEFHDAQQEPIDQDNNTVPTAASLHNVTGAHVSEKSFSAVAEEVNRRKASIKEAIEECESEANKIEAACADQYRIVMTGSIPNKRELIRRQEDFKNPDLWWIDRGIVHKSVLGTPVDGFVHAAIFTPNNFEGSRLASVCEYVFEGQEKGKDVENTHYYIEQSYTGWAYTNDSLLIYNGPAISATLTLALNSKNLDFVVKLHQGPPGCGKTTSIIQAATTSDVILVPVRKAARETSQRWAKKGKIFSRIATKQVKTLDSYLVNYHGNHLNAVHPDRLLADEAFMTREGRWLAAAALLGVKEISAYGDRFQIPHVPRAMCPKMYVSLRYATIEETFITYRCPAQMVACWNGVFGETVRSASQIEGTLQHVENAGKLVVPAGCVMMGMLQSDKKLLAEKYANCSVPIQIMTVHESQGNTYKDVWLHKFDLRQRQDGMSLYEREPYALVAMSRNTHSFVYVAPKNAKDTIAKWIERGKDPRRVNAAKDVESAGKPLAFM